MKSLKCFIWLLCGVGFREEDAELRKLVFEIPWERVETARLRYFDQFCMSGCLSDIRFWNFGFHRQFPHQFFNVKRPLKL